MQAQAFKSLRKKLVDVINEFYISDDSEDIQKYVNAGIEMKKEIENLEKSLSESQLAKEAAQNQFEEVQVKLEEFSTIHEENSNLKVENIQLENEGIHLLLSLTL